MATKEIEEKEYMSISVPVFNFPILFTQKETEIKDAICINLPFYEWFPRLVNIYMKNLLDCRIKCPETLAHGLTDLMFRISFLKKRIPSYSKTAVDFKTPHGVLFRYRPHGQITDPTHVVKGKKKKKRPNNLGQHIRDYTAYYQAPLSRREIKDYRYAYWAIRGHCFSIEINLTRKLKKNISRNVIHELIHAITHPGYWGEGFEDIFPQPLDQEWWENYQKVIVKTIYNL